MTACDLGKEDGGLGRLKLAEEEPPGALRIAPVVQQAARDMGDTLVSALPPDRHLPADAVDKVALPEPVLGPFGVEGKLGTFLLWTGNRHEVGAWAAAGRRLVSNPVLTK